jgi:hypothetical protein
MDCSPLQAQRPCPPFETWPLLDAVAYGTASLRCQAERCGSTACPESCQGPSPAPRQARAGPLGAQLEGGRWRGRARRHANAGPPQQRLGLGAARREGAPTGETARRFALPALPPEASRVAQAVRSHGPREHGVPWGLEGACCAAAGRPRQEPGPPHFAVVRPRARHLLPRQPYHPRGSTARRNQAGGSARLSSRC